MLAAIWSENSFAHRARASYLSYAGNMSIFSHIYSTYVSVQLGNVVNFRSNPRKKIQILYCDLKCFLIMIIIIKILLIKMQLLCCLLAIVAALKALQEKIHRLELEKSQAEDKLCSLSRAAAQYRRVLEHKSYEKDTAHQELMQERKGISFE